MPNTAGLYLAYFMPLAPDGSDQTLAIQAKIDALPDGTPEFPTVIKFTVGLNEGKYHTEGDLANDPRGVKGCLLFENRHNLVVEGPSAENPATFYTTQPAVPYGANVNKNTHSLRRHLRIKNCTNITVRNIRIEGSNYTEGENLVAGTPTFWGGGPDKGSDTGFPGYRACWELEHAFDIFDSQNILIEDCEVDSVWGDGVYIGNSLNNPSDGVVLRRLNLLWTGRQGVAMANCRNVLIDSVTVDHGRRAAIDMEPFSGQGFVTDVEIMNCTLHTLQTHFASLGNGDVSRINIHDNTLNGTGGTVRCEDSSGVTRRSDWTVKDNVRQTNFGSPGAPINFVKTDNVIVEGNTIPIVATQSRKCVKFVDCQGELAVTNNNFGNGLYIESINSAPITNSGNQPALTVI